MRVLLICGARHTLLVQVRPIPVSLEVAALLVAITPNAMRE
ncbi:MAG: hypothetical protein ACJA13_001427 [Paraglaciecola sp.]|jgi:hypothetical protein